LAQRRRPQTRSGLLPDAAQLVLPKGIVSTGFPATEATCRRIGIEFDPWQTDFNRCMLGKDRKGLYAADTVLMSVPRQVGKTYDVGGVTFADSIINPGTTTVWTAHRFKVARESFNEMRAWAKTPLLKPHIDYDEITTAAGNECIPFRNGSRIVFAARERGAIRGFTKVRRLVLDEGQILTEYALSDLVPTMNQAVNPQIVIMCTPPKPTDPGEVVTRIRAEALSGESDGVLYLELSAPADADLDDRAAWRKANLSFPTRTPARAISRMRKLLSADDFRREALGIWDADTGSDLISAAAWAALTDPDPSNAPEEMTNFGVEIDLNRVWVSIGAAGRRADGRIHVELVERRRGTDWLLDFCLELEEKHGPERFAIAGDGPAKTQVDDFKAAGLMVDRLDMNDVAKACADMVDAVNQGTIAHGPQPNLDAAIRGMKKRSLGDGAFAFSRKNSDDDVTPLLAITQARYAAVEFDYDVLESVY